MEAIPVSVRERIVALYERGRTTSQIADALGYCRAAVRRVRQRLRERGTLAPQTHRCGRKGAWSEDRARRLAGLVAARPDATLAELRDALGVAVSCSTIDRWLRRLGLTLKKSRRTRPSRRGRT
jgi:transposase